MGISGKSGRNAIKYDLTGQRFGRLVVLERSGRIGEKVAWLCRCDCGNTKRIRGEFLRRGATKSCGCLHNEIVADYMRIHSRSHGDSRSRLYGIWNGMRMRCDCPNDTSHAKDYALRGITYCEEWNKYENFKEWALANGYDEKLTLDRIDVNGNYSPENCRWATMTTQQRNKRNSRFIEWNGEIKTLSEWSEITGINSGCIARRLKHGWPIHEALTLPSNRGARLKGAG